MRLLLLRRRRSRSRRRLLSFNLIVLLDDCVIIIAGDISDVKFFPLRCRSSSDFEGDGHTGDACAFTRGHDGDAGAGGDAEDGVGDRLHRFSQGKLLLSEELCE